MSNNFVWPPAARFYMHLVDHWFPFLSGAELKLIGFIASNTLARGKESGHYREEHIRSGIPNRREGGMFNHGTGLARSSIYSAIKSLNEKGLITSYAHDKDGFKGGWTFTIHPERMPDEKLVQAWKAKKTRRKRNPVQTGGSKSD